MSQNAQLATEAAQAVEASGGIGTLGINLKIFVAQLVNFTVVLLVLWKWAYKPIVKILEERQAKIEKGVKQASEIETRVAQLERERQEIVATAKAQAGKIVEQAVAAAEDRKKAALEKARDEMKAIVAQGKGQLEAQKGQMMVEAREEMARLVVEAARKVLGSEIDEKSAMKMAGEAIDEVKV